jgi:hypothetical protein
MQTPPQRPLPPGPSCKLAIACGGWCFRTPGIKSHINASMPLLMIVATINYCRIKFKDFARRQAPKRKHDRVTPGGKHIFYFILLHIKLTCVRTQKVVARDMPRTTLETGEISDGVECS